MFLYSFPHFHISLTNFFCSTVQIGVFFVSLVSWFPFYFVIYILKSLFVSTRVETLVLFSSGLNLHVFSLFPLMEHVLLSAFAHVLIQTWLQVFLFPLLRTQKIPRDTFACSFFLQILLHFYLFPSLFTLSGHDLCYALYMFMQSLTSPDHSIPAFCILCNWFTFP